MREDPPRLRLKAQAGFSLLRDGMSFSFSIRHPHREIGRAVLHSLDTYVQAIGARALGRYVDEEGFAQQLDDRAWKRIRQELVEEEWSGIRLLDESSSEERYRFEYHGMPLDTPSLKDKPQASCTVDFWLPTEYLGEHGPDRVRELALALAHPLPFSFGQAGHSFNGQTHLAGVLREIRQWCFQYPGMDISEPGAYAWHLGTKVRGPSWLTFLGPPLLGELGGAAGLRSRLSSSRTTVREMPGARAVVTLGPRPEVGGSLQGNPLPTYRELARVLEPWLYQETRNLGPDFPPEDMRRWERRFLD